MAFDVSSLPEEVLMHIFQFLNIRNRLTASLVCKKWLHTINCHKLLCDIKIRFSKEFLKSVKPYSHMTRQFEWFSFNKIAVTNSVIEFLKQYSCQFVKLKFTDCKIIKCDSESKSQVLNCDNLKFLNIYNSDVITLFASLPNVTTLIIHVSSGLTDYIISELNKTLFKLEILSLGNSESCEETGYKIFYINEETTETNPSNSVLSFIGIKNFIENHSNTIKLINLAMLQSLPEAVVAISEIKGLKLESVLLPSDLPSRFIKKFCQNQFSLISLDLSIALYVTDDTVCALCKYLPNLEKLYIRHNRVTDKCIIGIFQLEHLVTLDLCNNENISQLSYQEAMLKIKSNKLKHLNLAFAQISDDNLCELLKRNVNIRHLNVAHTSLSNKTLNMICKNLIRMESLVLDSCRICDSGLTGEFENDSDSLTPTPLSNLKNLRKLDLSHNPLITNNGCIKAIQFPKLKALMFRECDGLLLENDFEIHLEKQNPYLHHLVISSHCKKYVKCIEKDVPCCCLL